MLKGTLDLLRSAETELPHPPWLFCEQPCYWCCEMWRGRTGNSCYSKDIATEHKWVLTFRQGKETENVAVVRTEEVLSWHIDLFVADFDFPVMYYKNFLVDVRILGAGYGCGFPLGRAARARLIMPSGNQYLFKSFSVMRNPSPSRQVLCQGAVRSRRWAKDCSSSSAVSRNLRWLSFNLRSICSSDRDQW